MFGLIWNKIFSLCFGHFKNSFKMRKFWCTVWNKFCFEVLNYSFSFFQITLPVLSSFFWPAAPFGESKCFKLKITQTKCCAAESPLSRLVGSMFLLPYFPHSIAARCSFEFLSCKLRYSQPLDFLKALHLLYFSFQVGWNSPGILAGQHSLIKPSVPFTF